MIEVTSLRKSFSGRKVLDGISLALERGKTLFVLGRSGVGKSVLLKSIVGLMAPDSGEISIEGKPALGLTEAELAPLRKACGMIFQYPALLDSLSVEQNLLFGLEAHGMEGGPTGRREKVLRSLSLVRLDVGTLPKLPTDLSFSEQKKVSLLRALLLDPSYLLFDEPTTGLDPVSTTLINELIVSLVKNLKVGAMVVSHDLPSALRIADEICLLEGGQAVFQGTPAEFRASSLPFARQFLRASEVSS